MISCRLLGGGVTDIGDYFDGFGLGVVELGFVVVGFGANVAHVFKGYKLNIITPLFNL